jgi:hypothetical protein
MMRCKSNLLTGGLVLVAFAVAVATADAAGSVGNNVTATVEGSNELVITGDEGNNSITIFSVNSVHLIVGRGGTTVNNRPFALLRGELTTTVIDMGAGDDSVVIATALDADATLEAEGGLGEDTLEVKGEIDVDAVLVISGFETLIPPDL